MQLYFKAFSFAPQYETILEDVLSPTQMNKMHPSLMGSLNSMHIFCPPAPRGRAMQEGSVYGQESGLETLPQEVAPGGSRASPSPHSRGASPSPSPTDLGPEQPQAY